MSYDELLARLKTDLTPTLQQSGMAHGWLFWTAIAIAVIAVLSFIASSFYTVHTMEFRIVERFGKFLKTSNAGFHFKLPFIDHAHEEWSLEIEQTVVKVETITADKVTVVMVVPVQHNIIAGHEMNAFYLLADVEARMTSVVFDVIRSEVPKLTLDEVFGSKDALALTTQEELRKDMAPFGYEINRVMITEVEPDAKVKAAMNEISAAQKQGQAELAKAHNEQMVQVAKAKGRLEAAELQKKAEIIDAEAVSKAVEIIGTSLHNNEGFLKYHWIRMMEQTSNATIYVPTEANLPILEAGKRPTIQGEGLALGGKTL